MRFAVSGVDQESGHPIEINVEAVDVPEAAAIAMRKGMSVAGVRAVSQMAPLQVSDAPLAPVSPKRKRFRLWLSLVLFIVGVLSPTIPAISLWTGIVVLVLVSLYVLPFTRRAVGGFLRVSPDRPVRRAFKLAAFIVIGVGLIGLSSIGREMVRDRQAAEVKRVADEAAKIQADAEASAKVVALVDNAKTSLGAGDVAKAESLLDEALKLAAPNRGIAQSLRADIRNSVDAEWVLAAIVGANDEEFARFRDGGTLPKSMDFGYSVLTNRVVALARPQIEAAAGKREEAKHQAAAAAEAERKAAEEKAAAERGEVTITREEYGDAWPFTVDSGVLRGVPTGQRTAGGTEIAEVTFTTGGKTYALNGTARGAARYAEIDGIWANHPSIVGIKKNIGPIIDRGLELAKRKSTPVRSSTAPEKLDASVSFTGTQFVITNENTYDWTDVKLEINYGVVSSGFVLRVARLQAGQKYQVGAAQFTKSDGERFNPFTHKPLKFAIFCKQGDYIGGWK